METRAPLASDQEIHSWHARPRLARLVGVTVVLVPVAVAAASGLLVATLLWKPSSVLEALVWWAIVLTCSLLCSGASENMVDKLLPLKALLQLSLVFPDQTPSRVKTALTAGSTRQLERLSHQRSAKGGRPRGAAEAELVLAMVGQLNGHDRRTRGHSERVRAFAELLGEQLKVAPSDREKLRWTALLHDLGKLDVSAEILNKHGLPDGREWQILQRHPEYGARRTRELTGWLGHWLLGVQQHHEHWDGTGYPRGLAGPSIDISGRIIAVADAFETMTVVRSYKKAMPAEAARQELADNAGAHFDPDVVRAFLQISVGDLRKAIGPFAWMVETPLLRDRPAEVLTVAAKGVAALATVIAVSLLGGHHPSNADPASVQASSAVSTTTTSTTTTTLPGGATAHPDPRPGAEPDPGTPVGPTTSTTLPLPLPLAPTLHDDSLVLDAGTTGAVDVLANDEAGTAPLAPATLAVTTAPASGTAAVAGTSVRYTAAGGFAGTVTVGYTVCDTGDLCDRATVTVTVRPVPAPVADSATTPEATPVTIPVLANDSGAAGTLDVSSLAVTAPVAHGATSVQPGGTIGYTPAAGYAGPDALTYRVCDAGGGCATATATITVQPVAVPANDTAVTPEATPVGVDILANDDPGAGTLDPASVTITAAAAHGTATINPGGSATYAPGAGYAGPDGFTYRVCDTGGPCATATVTIAVRPVAVPVADTATTPEATLVNIPVLANDDPGAGTLDLTSLLVTVAPTHGTTTVQPDGTIDYTPTTAYAGPDAFTYQVCDTSGPCATATVTITVQPVAAPVADTATTTEATLVNIPVLANDDPGAGTLDLTSPLVTVAPSHGTTTVQPDGTIDYTPTAGFAGTDTFTYQVCDTSGPCATATATITVQPVAVPAADTATTTEATLVNIPVLANDGPGAGAFDLTSLLVTGPASHGTTTALLDGSIDYTPTAGYAGPDTFTYRVCDTGGTCATATATITVQPVAVPAADTATTTEATLVNIPVLANDDPGAGTLDLTSLLVTVAPSHGTTTVQPDGTIDYTPTAAYAGPDAFTYQVCDVSGPCATATVTITVQPVAVPVADTATTPEATLVNIPVLANDGPGAGAFDLTSLLVTVAPTHGTTTVQPDGTIDYTPTVGYAGTDTFTYKVCDISGPCAIATVTITVQPVAVPVADTATTPEATLVNIPVLANDGPGAGAFDLTSLLVTGPASHGTTTALLDGTIDYTPTVGYAGPDAFTYQVCDVSGPCATATVTITVQPVAVPVADSATTPEATLVNIPVLGNDNPGAGTLDPASVTITAAAGHGTATVQPDGSIDYTPTAGYAGPDAFTYQVCDTNGPCATATVTITVQPIAGPVADTATTTEATLVNIPVLANDNPGAGTLDLTSLLVTVAPNHGTTTVKPDGTIDYTSTAGYAGPDGFTYQVCDTNGPCATATVTVTVQPVAGPAADTATTTEATLVNIPVLANDNPGAGTLDPASVTITSAAGHGTTTIQPDGSVDYTPTAGYAGTDTFTYRVCDTGGPCATATVTITVQAVAVPVADTATTPEATLVNIPVLANDNPGAGTLDPASVTITAAASHGTATVQPNSTIDYTPATGYAGTDTFTYRVCDTGGPCATATVTITVQPVAVPVADTATTTEATLVNIPVLANDNPGAGTLDPASVTITTAAGHGTTTIQPDGSVDYTPTAGYAGTDTFTYRVCDTGGPCATATVTITVQAVAVPVADTATTPEGTLVNVPVLANDDPGAGTLDPASVTITAAASHGTATVQPNSTIDYTPATGYAGTDTFTYRVCDTGGPCATATVTITVQAVAVSTDDSGVTTTDAFPVDLAVLANDGGGLGTLDPSSLAVTVAPAHGTTIVNSDHTVTYLPAGGYVGADSFTYQVCDLGGACSTATAGVSVQGRAVAAADSATTAFNTPVTVTVLANDTGGSGTLDPTSITISQAASHGAAVLNSGHTITYTPSSGWSGADLVLYQVCDVGGACATTSVTVTTSAQPVPLVQGDTFSVISSGSLDVLANDSGNGGTLNNSAVTIVTPLGQTSNSVTWNPSTHKFDFSGLNIITDQFTYQVCDTGGGCGQATVNLQAIGQSGPTVAADSTSTNEGTAVTVNVLGNDSGGTASTLAVTSPPTHGTAAVVTGKVKYTPNTGFTGTDKFVYQVCNSNVCGTATVTVTVSAVAPVAANDTATVASTGTVAIDVLANDSDAGGDLDRSSVVIVSPPLVGYVRVNPDGSIQYKPVHDALGAYTFTYQITDVHGATDTGTVTVTVT